MSDDVLTILIKDLNDKSDGMELDWRYTAGGIEFEPWTWDADTSDSEIMDAIEDASTGDAAENKDEAFSYWVEARDAARHQREIVKQLIRMLKKHGTSKLEYAAELAAELYRSEKEFGDAPCYGDIAARIEELRDMHT